VSTAEEFTEFAVSAAPRLRRTAFPLCGDWHTAEDLTQTTLASMFVSWRRISRQDAVYGYASRTLVNAFLSDRRRRRSRELLTGGAATIYLASKGQITPVWTATRTAGVPIGDNVVGQDQAVLAATPNGKTLYVADTEMSWVTPISTATNTAGPRITTGAGPYAIAVTPDGSTAYVANSKAGTVTPISTATNVPGRPIRLGGEPVGIGIAPGGDTAYVACVNSLRDPGTVVPISTVTNKAGTPIEIPVGPLAMVIVARTRGAA
jgi:YVTN family beta-propeller protein